MKTIDYLDLAKTRAKLPSDYALANALGVTRQSVSSWRSESRPRYPEVLHAVRIAELCQLEPLLVLADIEMDKAAHYAKAAEVDAWKGFLQRMGGVAASLVLGTVLSSPIPSNATPSQGQVNNNGSVYTLPKASKRRKTALWLDALFNGFTPA